MPYPATTVLQLGVPDDASAPRNSFVDRLANDQLLSGALVTVDQFAAAMTGTACFSLFAAITGSVSDLNVANGDAGSGFIGNEYNRGPARVIQEVIAFCNATGSNPAAVCRIDVQVQQGSVQPANFSTIFSGSAGGVFKPAVSGSGGGIGRSSTFVSGSNTLWPANTLLRAIIDLQSGVQAGLGAMRGMTVQIFWKPTGSYGA